MTRETGAGVLCPQHSDPRDTSVKNPATAPCTCWMSPRKPKIQTWGVAAGTLRVTRERGQYLGSMRTDQWYEHDKSFGHIPDEMCGWRWIPTSDIGYFLAGGDVATWAAKEQRLTAEMFEAANQR